MIRNDGELLRAFHAANDQAAFEELLQRHAALVFNVCNRILADRQEAEDATQAVFLTLARKAGTLQQRATVSTWLYQVAWHVATRARSASRARARLEVEAARMKESTTPNLPSQDALKALLDDALNALPLQYLQPLVLHHLEGRSEEEGARLMGLKLGTFSARLNRARELLRTRLAQRGVAFSSVVLLQEALRQTLAGPAPATLLAATAKAALLGKAGEAAAAQVVSPHTLQLFHGALKMLAVKQLKAVAALTACVLLIGTFGGLFYRSYATRKPGAKPVETAGNEQTSPAAIPGFVRVLGGAVFQPAGYVQHVAFSADEKFIASAGDKYVSIWEIATATERVRTTLQNGVWDVRFLKDDTLLILPSGDMSFESCSFMKWDWRRELKPRALPVPPSKKEFPFNKFVSGRFMTLFPDEQIALAPGGTPNGGMLKAVDLNTGLAIDGLDAVSRTDQHTHYGLQCISVSADGSRVACVDIANGWSGTNVQKDQNTPRFSIWDWKTKKLLHEWTKVASYVQGLAWMPDGEHLFVSGMGEWGKSSARILSAADGTEVRSFPGCGSLSPDGAAVTTFANGIIRTFSAQDGHELSSLPAPGIKFANEAVCSPQGTYFAVVSNGASFLLMDLKNERRLAPGADAHVNPPYCMDYSPDGRLLLYDGALTYAYDESGKRTQQFSSEMYAYGANFLLSDGRMLVAHGSENGKAEVWDSYTGKLLGHLGQNGNAVSFIQISNDDRWALLGYEYNGTVRFFDLSHGTPQSDLHGPTLSSSGPTQDVTRCIWTADGTKAFLADFSQRFGGLPEPGKPKAAPIGLSGAFDPATGKRLFWFQNHAKNPLQSVQELDLNPAGDQLYVYESEFPGTSATSALVSASDGTFIRDMDFPGINSRFTLDGKLLAGNDAVVDVQSGKVIRKFGATGTKLFSRSRTQLAQLDAGKISIWDVRSGLLVWQCQLDPRLVEKPHAVSWNFNENQLAISPKEGSAVLQLDLYANVPAAAKIDAKDPAVVGRAISDPDVETRQAAVQACVEQSEDSLPVLMNLVNAPQQNAGKPGDSVTLQCRMAIVALERIAREKNKLGEVLAFFGKQAVLLDETRAAACRDAVLRLNAAVRAQELKAKLAHPAPLTWPLKESSPEKSGDF